MPKYTDFDSAIAANAQEPITFKLAGIEWKAPLPLPLEPVLELAKIADLEVENGKANLGQIVDALTAFRTFIAAMVAPEQQEQFPQAVINARIPYDVLVDVASMLIEEVTGGPLDEQSPSPTPPSPTGDLSTVAAALEASTSSNAMPTPAST